MHVGPNWAHLGAVRAEVLTWWLIYRPFAFLACRHPSLQTCRPLPLPFGQHGTHGSASHLRKSYILDSGRSAPARRAFDSVSTSHRSPLQAVLRHVQLQELVFLRSWCGHGMHRARCAPAGMQEHTSRNAQSRLLTSRDAAQAGPCALQVVCAVAAIAQQQHIAFVRLIAHTAPAKDSNARLTLPLL